MKCFTVNPSDIEERLDCFFYSPENREAVKSKYTIFRIGDVTKKVIHPPEYKREYSGSGYQLLRAQNVRPYGIDLRNNRVFFDKSYLAEKRVIFPQAGDVLVVRSGVNTGDCAVIDKSYTDIILGADNLVCKCKESLSPYFLQIYLNSNTGKRLLDKYITGATNSHITPENLKKIKIPLPPLETQNRIVSIMQSAYEQKKQKEQEAKKLLGSINEFVLSELGIKLSEVKEKMCFIAWIDEVKGHRLDPKKYSETPQAILKAMQKSKFKSKELTKIIVDNISGEWGEEKQQNGYTLCKVLRNTNFDNRLNLNFDDVAERFISEEKLRKIRLRNGDILIEKSGGSPIQPVGRVALIENIEGNFVFSNFLQCLRINKEDCLPEYLFTYLKAIYSLNYMEYLQNQTTGIKNLIMEEYLTMPIVLPPLEIQRKIVKEGKDKMTQAKKLESEANSLIEQAKQEVEAIILGK